MLSPKLLPTKDYKTCKGKDEAGNSIEYYADRILISFDYATKKFQIGVNELGTEEVYLKNFKILFKEFEALTARRHKYFVIWTTHLKSLLPLIKELAPDGITVERKNEVKGNQVWVYRTNKFEFRNFDIICNETDLSVLKESYDFPSTEGCGIMRDYLEMRKEQGFTTWARLNYSFIYMENKLFGKGIDTKIVVNSTPTEYDFNNFMKMCRHGILAVDQTLKQKFVSNIYGPDKSSAYPSGFISLKMPIGRFHSTENSFENLKKLWDSGERFYVVIKCKRKFEGILFETSIDYQKIGDEYYYVLTDFDLAAALKIYDFNEMGVKLVNVRVAEKTDYLPIEIRERIISLYNQKQSNKGKSKTKYYTAKTTLDAIWGKAIQRTPYNWRNQASKLIKPQWSLWTASYLRYEIICLIEQIGLENVIAIDTDGIKTKGDFTSIFEAHNEEIRKANREAGFESEIGIWDTSEHYDEFIQFEKKVYAEVINGEIECKFAGCRKPAWKGFYSVDGIKKLKERKPISADYCCSYGVQYKNGVLRVYGSGYNLGGDLFGI